MFRTLVTAVALLALAAPALGQSDIIRFGGWNITNLHHESGVRYVTAPSRATISTLTIFASSRRA